MSWTNLLRGLLLGLCLCAGQAGATAQEPDLLIVEGQPQPLYTNPLAAWLEAHPDRLPRGDSMRSSNWRGYIATWELAGGKLWLRRVDVRFQRATPAPDAEPWDNYEKRNVRAQLFPEHSEVVAGWYTGTLILPRGELLNYVHMGYGSTYERYLVVWVRGGEVLRQLELSAEQFLELRRERFRAWQQTEAYRKQLGERRGAADEEEYARFLFEFLTEQYLSYDPALDRDN